MSLIPNRVNYPDFWRDKGKPNFPVDIDWTHERCVGLSGYWFFGGIDLGGGKLLDLANMAPMPFQSSPTPSWSGSNEGTVVNFPDASNTYAYIDKTYLPYTAVTGFTTGITIAIRLLFTSFNGAFQGVTGVSFGAPGNPTTGGGLQLGAGNNGSNSTFAFIVQPANADFADLEGGIPAANTWYTMVATASGTSVQNLYVDGTNVVTNATSLGAAASTWTRTAFGAAAYTDSTLGENMHGNVSWIGMWNRVLSAAEINDLSYRPFAHLKPRGSRDSVPSTTAPGTLTTTFDAYLSAKKTKTSTYDAILNRKVTLTTTFDGVLSAKRTKTATFDGVLVAAAAKTKTLTFDAYLVLAKHNLTSSYDAVLQRYFVAMPENYIVLPGVQRSIPV